MSETQKGILIRPQKAFLEKEFQWVPPDFVTSGTLEEGLLWSVSTGHRFKTFHSIWCISFLCSERESMFFWSSHRYDPHTRFGSGSVCVGYKLLWPAYVVLSLQKWCQLEGKLQRPSAYGLIQEKRIIQHEMTKTVICEWEQKKSHQMTVSGCHALKLFWRYVLTSAHELHGMVLHNSLTYSLSFERKKWQKEQETVGIECVKD